MALKEKRSGFDRYADKVLREDRGLRLAYLAELAREPIGDHLVGGGLDGQRGELAGADMVVEPAVLELGQRGGQDQEADDGHEQHGQDQESG